MWNLLHVMQVLAYMRNYVLLPAKTTSVLKQIEESIYLKELTDEILEMGESEFEVAQ